MSLASSISRVTGFYGRHGLAATARRAWLAAARTLSAGRMVVFYYDLTGDSLQKAADLGDLKVQRVSAPTELSTSDADKITGFWNERLATDNLRERFQRGACLWLARLEGELAGYGWTLQGDTIEPYYLPLTRDDIHLFDFHVFPVFRGRGVNPYLVSEILTTLSGEGIGRAFIDVAEWNIAQLSSIRKTPLRYFGTVRSFRFLKMNFVSWKNAPREDEGAIGSKH